MVQVYRRGFKDCVGVLATRCVFVFGIQELDIASHTKWGNSSSLSTTTVKTTESSFFHRKGVYCLMAAPFRLHPRIPLTSLPTVSPSDITP